LHSAALVIIFLTVVISLILGLLAARGKQMNLQQWTVAGRSFGALFVFLLMAGDIYTTFTFLGGSGWSYGVGGPTLYILSYGSLAYVLAYFMLPRIWRYAKTHNLISQPDYFEHRFQSRGLSMLVALVGVVAIIPYLQSQFTGLGLIVEIASYGSISAVWGMVIAMFVIAIYVTLSGVRGSAWTAALKDIVLLAVVLFIGIALPLHVGGFSAMFHKIDALKPGFLTFGSTAQGIPWFISTVLMTAVGFYMWPHAFGAVYTAKSERVFRNNAMFLPLYQLILLFVFFVGFAAILIVPGLTNSNLALMSAVTKVYAPWFVGVIGGAGMLAALVPGSLMLIGASTLLAENIYRPLSRSATPSQVQLVARVLVWVIAAITLFFSANSNATIVALLLMGYNFVTQFFPAVILGVFTKRGANRIGAISGILVGVIMVAIFSLTGTSIIWGLNSGFLAVIANAIVVLAVSAATPSSAVVESSSAKATPAD
jgi:SSS family solute:Na+ symporter